MCALCPRCLAADETNAHIYACANPEAVNKRTQDWGELQKQFAKVQTATLIQHVWALQLRPIIALPPVTETLEQIVSETHDEINFLLREAIDEQEAIGWNKLLMGMASSKWQSLQHHIDANKPKLPDRDADDWMNRAVHQLLKFSLRRWKERNVAIHGETYKERKQKELEAARTRIKEIYTNPPALAPQFRLITEVPLLKRLRLSLPAAEHWIALIEHQIKVTKHNLKILLRTPTPPHPGAYSDHGAGKASQ